MYERNSFHYRLSPTIQKNVLSWMSEYHLSEVPALESLSKFLRSAILTRIPLKLKVRVAMINRTELVDCAWVIGPICRLIMISFRRGFRLLTYLITSLLSILFVCVGVAVWRYPIFRLFVRNLVRLNPSWAPVTSL